MHGTTKKITFRNFIFLFSVSMPKRHISVKFLKT